MASVLSCGGCCWPHVVLRLGGICWRRLAKPNRAAKYLKPAAKAAEASGVKPKCLYQAPGDVVLFVSFGRFFVVRALFMRATSSKQSAFSFRPRLFGSVVRTDVARAPIRDGAFASKKSPALPPPAPRPGRYADCQPPPMPRHPQPHEIARRRVQSGGVGDDGGAHRQRAFEHGSAPRKTGPRCRRMERFRHGHLAWAPGKGQPTQAAAGLCLQGTRALRRPILATLARYRQESGGAAIDHARNFTTLDSAAATGRRGTIFRPFRHQPRAAVEKRGALVGPHDFVRNRMRHAASAISGSKAVGFRRPRRRLERKPCAVTSSPASRCTSFRRRYR